MKKFLLIAISALIFAACTNDNMDNDDNGNGGQDEKVTFTVIYESGIEDSDDLMFYDMKVSYKNAEGKMEEKTITELPLKIEIKGVEKPFTAEITPTYTLKNPEDVTIDKETYTFSDFGIMISAIGNDGLLMASGSIGYATVDAENIYNYLNECIKDSNGVTSKLEIK